MVMHVALEYSVPHLGLNSELMFGGLGKVGLGGISGLCRREGGWVSGWVAGHCGGNLPSLHTPQRCATCNPTM